MRFEIDGRAAYAYTGGKSPQAALTAGRPALVFVHGALHDHSVWILQSRYLAHHGWPVLALDLPGHGRSAGPLLPDIEAMADWMVRAATVAIGSGAAPRIIPVGHSMGSLVALDAAARHPGVVAAACLVATTFPMKVSEALLAAARDDEARALDMINLWSHSRLDHRPGTPGPGFSVFVQNRRLMERQPPGTVLHDFQACNAYAAGLQRADAVKCPVLVVQGARDLMVPPKSARTLLEHLPQSQTVIVPDAGHAVMTESPDRMLEALAGWLGALPAAVTQSQ